MYPSQQQSTIGTLLRMIQEDQSKNLPVSTPGTEPQSAIRQTVQGPLTSPEDTGSSHVVSVRPEGVTSSGTPVIPQAVQGVTPPSPAPTVIPPVAPVAPAPAAPAAPVAPTPRPAPQVPSPAVATVLRSAAPAPGTRPAPVATRIQASVGQRATTPQRSRIGVQLATNLKSRQPSFIA